MFEVTGEVLLGVLSLSTMTLRHTMGIFHPLLRQIRSQLLTPVPPSLLTPLTASPAGSSRNSAWRLSLHQILHMRYRPVWSRDMDLA